MKRTIEIVCVSILIFLCATGWSQNFPVRVNPILTPPYTPFITDYTEAGSDRLTLHVLLNDLTVNNYHCKLRLTIEGVNISIATDPNYSPPPLILQGGSAEILYGADLVNYFNFNNLIFKGISKNEIEKNGYKLPEGIYSFTFEIIDYNRNVVVSNKGVATAWMLLNEPPFINLPLNDSKVKPLDPQNIVFQWTPRHRGSPNSAFTTEYEVKLYEIWPRGRNAFDAVNSSRPIFETTTDATMAVYGQTETPLVLGREYALQVKAKDTGGKDLFRNNGLSEVIKFTYGDECPMPVDLHVDNISNNKARIRWQSNALNTGYVLRYREKRTGTEWFEENTAQAYFSATGLQPATTYEYQLAGQCLSYYSNYTEQKTLTTLIINSSAFICGDPRAIPVPDGSPPLLVLMTNDSIKAGGFDIIVNKATGTAGKFSGEGIAIIPWFNYAKVRITFENITVNKSYQLTGGSINSVWDKDSKLLRTFEQLNNKDTVSSTFKSDVATFEADSTVLVIGMILSVTANASGNISISTADGGSIVLEKGKSYAIVDEAGNGYLVDKDGSIKKTTATDAINAGNKGEREYSTDPHRSVLFTRSTQTKYGFDAFRDGTLSQNYQQTENGKYIAWKALASGLNDFVQVQGEGNTDLSKIKFKLEGVTSQELMANNQQLTLTGNINGTNEEVLAVDNSSDTTKNGQILGKINLISYSQQTKNLVMVAVNKTTVPVTYNEVSESLNKIYGQAVVAWNVSGTIQHLEVADFDEAKVDDGGSGLLSNYTADMKKVLNAYLNGNSLADDTYYLFFVTNAQSGNKLGYMPRSKQAGFIFTGAHLGNTELLHTIAHELGHGAFHLKHNFSEFPSISEGSSDNLMDYSSGTALDKYQWDYIHNPEGVLGLFEDDEEGAMVDAQVQVSAYLMDLGFEKCLLRALSRSVKEPSLDFKFLVAAIEGALCATEEDKCKDSGYWTKFGYGLANGIVQQLDIPAMRDALIGLSKSQLKNKLECIVNGEMLKISIVSDLELKQQLQLLLKCEFGIDIKFDEVALIWDKAIEYVNTKFPDPYVRGQATAIVLTIALPPISKAIYAGKLTQLVSKLRGLRGFATEAANLERIVAAKADEVGGVLDDVIKNSNKLGSSLNGTLRILYDQLISKGIKYVDDGISVKFLNPSGEEIGVITKNKFTPSKWISTRRISPSLITETDEGYYLVDIGKGEFAFNLGFKEGRVISAEEANIYFKSIGRNEPYKLGTPVIERSLQIGDKVYVVENFNKGVPSPGAWGSKNAISTEKELREYLAVLEDWKKANGITDPLVVREYVVKSPMRVRDGRIGPQMEKFPDGSIKIYYGGEHQYEFIEDISGMAWRDFLDIVDSNGFILK